MTQTIINGDCFQHLAELEENSIDVVVTSPPYNIGKKYNSYKDQKQLTEYLDWIERCFVLIKRALKQDGSFFLNVSNTAKYPYTTWDILSVARKHFNLQNQIIWAKSVTVDNKNYGHFKPVISPKYVNNLYEFVFHLTKQPNPIDRLAIGVPYSDKFNAERWGDKPDLRCIGNLWFIPYETTSPKTTIKKNHPASFPSKLPENCILLHGLKPDIKVLDPFLGTGATLVACKKLNVTGIGVEIDEEYCAIAQEILGIL